MASKLNLISEMLLIEDPSVFKLYTELNTFAKHFVAPVFVVGVIAAFLGDFNILAVIKKLIIVTVFMAGFYQFHTVAVNTALKTASITLEKVSPRNLFIKKWYEPKVRTAKNKSWNILDRFAVPNLNDLLASGLFVISKAFIWLLKLIYSTVYHLAYVFSGITAVLFFLGWTQDALKGTIQASIWCMLLPFVVVAVLALVGNSFTHEAEHGALAVSSIDNLIWLFGVTLLLLITPAITFGMVKGDGPHSFAPNITSLMKVGAGSAIVAPAVMKSYYNKAQSSYYRAKWIGKQAARSVMDKIRPQKNTGQSAPQTSPSGSMANNDQTAIHTNTKNSIASQRPIIMGQTNTARTVQGSTPSKIVEGNSPVMPRTTKQVHEQKATQFSGGTRYPQARPNTQKEQTRNIKTTVPDTRPLQISKIVGPVMSKTVPHTRSPLTRPNNRPEIQRPSIHKHSVERGRHEV